jgi:hypothetical protein
MAPGQNIPWCDSRDGSKIRGENDKIPEQPFQMLRTTNKALQELNSGTGRHLLPRFTPYRLGFRHPAMEIARWQLEYNPRQNGSVLPRTLGLVILNVDLEAGGLAHGIRR